MGVRYRKDMQDGRTCVSNYAKGQGDRHNRHQNDTPYVPVRGLNDTEHLVDVESLILQQNKERRTGSAGYLLTVSKMITLT